MKTNQDYKMKVLKKLTLLPSMHVSLWQRQLKFVNFLFCKSDGYEQMYLCSTIIIKEYWKLATFCKKKEKSA